jgi:hypothetical protein
LLRGQVVGWRRIAGSFYGTLQGCAWLCSGYKKRPFPVVRKVFLRITGLSHPLWETRSTVTTIFSMDECIFGLRVTNMGIVFGAAKQFP